MTNFKIQIFRNGKWEDLEWFDNEKIIKVGNPFDRLDYWYYEVCKERNKLRLIIETIEIIKEME